MYIPRSQATPELKALGKVLGYGKMPPDIIEFVESPYYLGNSVDVFPFWKEKLMEIYPTPLHTKYPIISLNCAIGSGKTTMTKVMELYTECRFDHMDDISVLGIGKTLTKPICSYFFHTSNDKAKSEFEYSIKEMKKNSAYFQSGMRHPNRWVQYVADSTRTNAAIGRDIIFLAFSEVNFTHYQKTYDKIDTGLQRFENRFRGIMKHLGNVVLDSSPGSTSSVAVDFVKNNPGLDIYTLYAPIWEAHKHKNHFFKKGTFRVYLGDSNYDPFVIEGDRPLTDQMDPDNVLEVPMELYRDFKSDIIKAIQNLAGISTDSTGSFFKSKDLLRDSFKLPMYCKDTIIYDMYDPSDRLMDHVSNAVSMLLPKDKVLFVGLDIGLTNDHTGLSIGYFNGYYYPVPGNKKSKTPTYSIPLAISISRLPGQETNISKITEFILELSKEYHIGCVTADSFQSRNLLQDLKTSGIDTAYISNDRDNTSYNYLKTCVYNGHIELPQNKRLEDELKNLQFLGGKVDHPNDGCFTAETSILVRVKDSGLVTEVSIYEIVLSPNSYEVMSVDEVTNIPYWTNVKNACLTKEVTELVELHYDTGDVYRCTLDHRFWIEGTYVQADQLVEGENGLIRKYRTSHSIPVPVFDIEVEGRNPNFTLSNGTVVHNSKDIADSVASVTLCMFKNLDKADKPSSHNLTEKTGDLITKLAEKKKSNQAEHVRSRILGETMSNIF